GRAQESQAGTRAGRDALAPPRRLPRPGRSPRRPWLHPGGRGVAPVVVRSGARSRPGRPGGGPARAARAGAVRACAQLHRSWPLIAAVARLCAWAHPALWLTLPVLLLAWGADALWVGLLVVASPLLAAGLGTDTGPGRAAALAVGVLIVTSGLLLWADFAVARDLAAWLGRPRSPGTGLG